MVSLWFIVSPGRGIGVFLEYCATVRIGLRLLPLDVTNTGLRFETVVGRYCCRRGGFVLISYTSNDDPKLHRFLTFYVWLISRVLS